MKKIIYSITTALLLLSLESIAQTETREVSGYSGISSSGPFNIHINIDGTESLKIEAGADAISKIETFVEDGTLSIKFKKQSDHWMHNNYGKIDIYVTAKSLSAISNSGSGSMKVEGAVTGTDVSIALSGSGDIVTSIKSGKLNAAISGSGSIHLTGNAQESQIRISGSGSLMGKQLATGSASVSIAGSGNAYVMANKTISASIVGSGNVIYTGNASITNSRTIGSGRISKED